MKKRTASGPLMCWDLFMQSHFQRMQQAEGLTGLQKFSQQHRWRIDWDFKRLLLAEECVALVTDPAQIIRFATPNMTAMNGYLVEEVMGKSPKMFQGEGTDAEVRRQLREALVRRLPFKGTLVNYRKEGTPYNCLVEEYPVWNKQGSLVHFIAFEKIA